MSKTRYRSENDCLNCGHIVEEQFCPKCGQENLIVKENAIHMVSHAIADYFHFEHKFFGTLKPLLFIPGQLTKEYIAGKRLSFIHPIRLYIFISIVFFLVMLKDESKETTEKKQYNKETKSNAYAKQKNDWSYIGDGNLESKNDTTLEAYEKRQLKLADNKKDGFFARQFNRKKIELRLDPDSGKKFKEGVVHNVPKMMFLLLPLFALILKLVYIRKDKYYFEHLIFSFHLHSAIFLSILLALFINWISSFYTNIESYIITTVSLYVVWYIYRALRNFYGSKRWITILKLSFLSIAYFTLLILSLVVTAIATVYL
ncbi:MAG: DUF3667 domain-containing protein [Sphingobacteriaceae bacterium]|nr:DUF3667 domain-containing protein [Sphingobacteriaceae bacterium]